MSRWFPGQSPVPAVCQPSRLARFRQLFTPGHTRTVSRPPHQARLPPSHDIRMGFNIIRDQHGQLREHWWYYRLPHHQKSLITIATTGAGKMACQLSYELVGFGGEIDDIRPSVIMNDKKGELIALCARARYELGDTVYTIDPFKTVAPSPFIINAVWNPLHGIKPVSPHFTKDVLSIADGLLVMEGKEPHFIHRGRQFLAALVGHLCDDSNNEPASLPYMMQRVLGLPDSQLKAYMGLLAERSPVPLVRSLASAFTADTREVSSIISSVVGQLGFLLDTSIAAAMNGTSSFSWDEVKQGGISLFFVMPEAESLAFSRFNRLFWASCINAMYRPPFHPVLAVIDEASNSLGGSTLEVFEHAFSLWRVFGLSLHLLFQNLPQLKALFREQADSILGAAGVVQCFRPNDHTTAEYMSQRAGHHTVSTMNESTSFSFSTSESRNECTASSSINTSFSTQHHDRPIWTEQELFDMPDNKQVLFFDGIGAPVVTFRKPYWQSGWKPRFDSNPYAPRGR